jgi:hypothetical protein
VQAEVVLLEVAVGVEVDGLDGDDGCGEGANRSGETCASIPRAFSLSIFLVWTLRLLRWACRLFLVVPFVVRMVRRRKRRKRRSFVIPR